MPITVQDAAQELAIDVKTLRRWLKREHVELTADPADRRRRLIAQAQFEQLRRARAPSAAAHGGGTPSEAEQPNRDELKEQLAALQNALAQSVSSLHVSFAAVVYNVALLIQRVAELEAAFRKLGQQTGESAAAENSRPKSATTGPEPSPSAPLGMPQGLPSLPSGAFQAGVPALTDVAQWLYRLGEPSNRAPSDEGTARKEAG